MKNLYLLATSVTKHNKPFRRKRNLPGQKHVGRPRFVWCCNLRILLVMRALSVKS